MLDGNRLKTARRAKKLTQKALAELLGVSEQAVSQWERGENSPEFARVVKLAEILGQTVDHFSGSAAAHPASGRSGKWYVPRVNSVTAGAWSEVVRSMDETDYIFLEIGFKPIGDCFALELEGTSMAPDFNPGDDVIVDTGVKPSPGDYVIAKLDGEDRATFKKYRLKGYDDDGSEIVELVPINPDYPTLEISSRRPGRIVAVVVEHRRRLKGR